MSHYIQNLLQLYGCDARILHNQRMNERRLYGVYKTNIKFLE